MVIVQYCNYLILISFLCLIQMNDCSIRVSCSFNKKIVYVFKMQLTVNWLVIKHYIYNKMCVSKQIYSCAYHIMQV